jgi:arginine exporter protein ArgO
MTPTDAIAYAVPAFFVFAMGAVLLTELAAEPYGLKLAGSTIDTGSRVISMLAPTVLRGLVYLAIIVAIVGAIAASFTKTGAKWFASIASGGGGVKGRRGD